MIRCPTCDEVAQRREDAYFCPPCGRIFDTETKALSTAPKMPDSFEIVQSGGQLLVTWPWMRKSEWKYFPLVILFIAAAVVGIFFLWREDMSLFVKALFTLALVLPSLGGAYDRACVLLNRARLYADAGQVTLSHGPLPGRAARAFDATEVEQFFCVERPTLKGPVYDVRLLTKEKEHQTLLRNLENAEQALFIEHALEAFLQIVDEPVEGEIQSDA